MSFFTRIMAFLSRSNKHVTPKFVSPYVKYMGALIDKTDARDKKYEINPVSTTFVPEFSTLVEFSSTIKNQGFLGSCVAHAAAVLYFIELKRNEKTDFDASEMQLYYDGRKESNLFPQDSGMYPRDVLKVMLHKGIAPEMSCRYDEFNYNSSPSITARGWQRYFKIKSYHSISNILAAKQEIVSGHGVMVNVPVYDSFFKATTEIPIPKKVERLHGFHELPIIAYDDMSKNSDGTRGSFLVQNSWGIGWGIGGRTWLPYSYFTVSGCEQSSFYSIRI